MANPTTNYGFVLPTSSDLVTDLPADFEVALQGVDTQMKTNADAATQKATLTTKGDIYAASAASTPARLAVGTNGQVLTADSTASTGLAWSTISSGGMTLLSTTTMSGTSTTVSSISQSYKQLVIQVLDFYPSPTQGGFRFRLNSDATANSYLYLQQQGDSASPYSAASPQWFFADSSFQVQATNKNADTNAFLWIELPNYTDTTTNKFARYQSFWTNFGNNKQTTFSHGIWENTAAVSSIEFSNNGQTAGGGTIKIWGVN